MAACDPCGEEMNMGKTSADKMTNKLDGKKKNKKSTKEKKKSALVLGSSKEKHLAKIVVGTDVFPVDVDTEARFVMVLRRVARTWAHKHKRSTLVSTARSIRDEAARIRKGALLPNLSQYFKKLKGPVPKERGRLELSVISRLQKLGHADRDIFFLGRYDKMKKNAEK